MAWVRGQERYVFKRVYESVTDLLMGPMGWDGVLLSGARPYGAKQPLTCRDEPDPDRTNADPIVPNAIAFTEGPMPDDVELELGDGLQETRHTIFIDIYGESLSIAKALASDVRSILTGRQPGSNRYLYLPDYGTAGLPLLPGHLVHFEDVMASFPDGLNKQNWAVVKVTAVHEWNP